MSYQETYQETSRTLNNMLNEIRMMEMAIDNHAPAMAQALVGRLRCLQTRRDTNTLIALKKELADFNMTTRQWKSK